MINPCNSYIKWEIGNDIREMMLANSAITGYVSTNIYPLVAPEGVDGEFILYQRDKYRRESTKMGVYEDICNIIVTIVSDSYDTAILLAKEVDKSLSGKHIKDNTNIKIDISLIDSSESYEDNRYIETLLFEIK